jgi:hypothetical protein
LRLGLESYFDIVLSAFLNVVDFYEAKSFDELSLNVATVADTQNTVFAVVFLFWSLAFPFWVHWKLRKHFRELDTPEVRRVYGVLYEDVRTDEFHSSQYNFYFVARRLVITGALTFTPEATLAAHFVLQFLSSFNLVYLIAIGPLASRALNQTEIINEVGVAIASHLTSCFFDASLD